MREKKHNWKFGILNNVQISHLRCDYEMVDSEGANKMMELLRQTADNGSLVDKTLTGGSGQDQKTYQVKLMDDFSYKDPIDGSVSKKQVA